MPERFALYYAPSVTSPIWARAAHWLGRDARAGTSVEGAIDGIATAYRVGITRLARRYGFHATLKAPMQLADGMTRSGLSDALRHFGRGQPPAAIGRLKVASIDGFIALIPEMQTVELTETAATIVRHFDRFRAPLSPADREQRIAASRLTAQQIELLDRFGYPYVLEEFRFHMTLTDRLADAAEHAAVMEVASAWFADVLDEPYRLDRIVLFHEPCPGAPFLRLDDYELKAEAGIHA